MPTPEQIATIQKLIDKGVPQEDIQTVIDHFKAQASVTPVGKGEPDTYWGGVAKGALEGGVGGAVGFFKNIVPATVSAANPVNLAKGAFSMSADVASGLANFVKDPGATTEEVKANLLKLGPNTVSMITKAANLAAQDPEAFGKMTADVTGGALVAAATAKLVPMMPKPLAAKVGASLARVGKAGEFAAYLTGAHQLASGDPKGLVTLALPAAMRAASKPLIKFGTNMAEVPVAQQIAMQPEVPPTALHNVEGTLPPTEAPIRPAGGPPTGASTIRFNDQPLHQQMEQLPTTGPDPLSNPNRGPEPRVTAPAPPVEPPPVPGAFTPAERAGLVKQGQSEGAIQRIEALRIKNASAAVNSKIGQAITPPPPDANLGTGAINLEGPNVVPDSDPRLAPQRDFRGVSEQDLRNASNQDNIPTSAAGRMTLPTETGLQVPDEESWFANKPSEMGTQADYLESQTHVPHIDVEGEGPVSEGSNRPPSTQSVGGDLGTSPSFEEQLLQSAGKPPEPSAGPITPKPVKLDVPARPIPKSKSRRSPMSATPGLTVEDMTGLGLDPKTTLTKVTQEVVDKVLANRAARSQAYRTNAGLDTGFANSLMDASK